MYAESVSSCRKSRIIGAVISFIGVLIALGSLNVLARADGDLFAIDTASDRSAAPAWTIMMLLIVFGTAVFAYGVLAAWAGCRLAREAAEVDTEEIAAAQRALGQASGPFIN